jgi:alpha-D-ribose 1-methylphosphonate 5-triphosphate synthase subunit PhnH
MVIPATAFPEPVLASAVLFRAVMDAFARPGEVRPLTGVAAPPSPLSATAAALGHRLARL